MGGKEGYKLVKEADETATNPGDALRELFNRYAPCLILIDEWVAYARQLHDNGGLEGGTFDKSSSATITAAIKDGSTGSRSFSLRRPGLLRRLPVADPGREGLSNDVIAARLDTPRQIVSKWSKRFFESSRRTTAWRRPRPLFLPGVVVAVKSARL